MDINKKRTITTYISFIILYFILFSLVLLFEYNNKDNNPNSTMYNWSAGWTIDINDKVSKPVSITDFSFKPLTKGSTVELTNVIPVSNIDYPVIVLQANYATINVFINGILEYSYGNELFMENKLVGCGFHYIPIDDHINDQTPAEVKIILTATENNSMSSIFPIYIAPALNAKTEIIQKSPFTFYSCLFLIFVGISLTIISIGGFAFKKKYYTLLALSQFSLWTGLGRY